jgi:hypothetical protein
MNQHRVSAPLLLHAGVLFVALGCLAGSASAADRFVSPGGRDGANDCLSSSAPCATLGQALSTAATGDTIKLAKGRYRENLSILSSINLTLSGGWTSDFGSRDPAAHTTVLDGRHVAAILDIEAGVGETIDLTLDGLTLTRGSGSGGAIYVQSAGVLKLAVTDCVLKGNTGGNGAAVYADAGGTSPMELLFTRSAVVKNRSGLGGGIRLLASSANLKVESCTIADNRGGIGGGLMVEGVGTDPINVTIVDSTVTRNRPPARSAGSGGGIWLGGDSAMTVAITNSFVTRNKSGDGGGIYAEGSLHLDITNCTVSSNRAFFPSVTEGFGGGMVLSGAVTASLKNTILWGNRALHAEDLLFMFPAGSGPAVDADHDDIHDRVTAGGTFNDLGGNIDANPRLTATAQARLNPSSPAIDAGSCAGAPPTDFEGDSRPSGAGCDMGADEFVP